MKDYENNKRCSENSCEYYDSMMELHCSYSEDNSKCIKSVEPLSSDAVLAEVAPRKGFNAGRVVLHCGNCNSTNIRLNIDSCNQKHFKYCPDCGSKVDWRNFS